MYVTITKYPYLMLDCERRAEMGLIEKKENKSSEDMKRDLLNVIDCLADYEESGLK